MVEVNGLEPLTLWQMLSSELNFGARGSNSLHLGKVALYQMSYGRTFPCVCAGLFYRRR